MAAEAASAAPRLPLGSATRAAVSVWVPLAVPGAFTYLVPPNQAELRAVGKRVVVAFGRQKFYTGVIVGLEEVDPDTYPGKLKTVEEIVDEAPAVTPEALELYAWLADYYLCTPGEVLKAALPARLKVQSRTRLLPLPLDDEQRQALDDAAYLLIEALDVRGQLTMDEAAQLLGLNDPRPKVRHLASQGLLRLLEAVEDDYRPKTETRYHLAPAYASPEGLQQGLEELARAQRQANGLLQAFHAHSQGKPLTRQQFLDAGQVGASALQALVDKGYLTKEAVEVPRLAETHALPGTPPTLTPAQQTALDEVRDHLAKQPTRPVYLYGVTGSGKTLLYLDLIRQVLAQGQQALYLLPEIGLTEQIVHRVREALGPGVAIYHSRFSPDERVELWLGVLQGRTRVVVGVRSALLLPFQDLGLVVVDEEHDPSFKQHDPAPRYHARDAALWLAHQRGIPVVLGSATPSLESWRNAQGGKYALVTLAERAFARTPPTVEVVDLKAQAAHQLSDGLFSEPLLQALTQTLQAGQQAILFRNRRGYSPYLLCQVCEHVPMCPHCDLSLTYHKPDHRLRCHACGYLAQPPSRCPSCNAPDMARMGLGTQRIEEDLEARFPNVAIARMDQDTTRGKRGFERLFASLKNGDIQLLVGTQMVAKGLDFPNVTLAAVLQADDMLTRPDFRAAEDAMQVLTQFIGRAGRGQLPGRVILQTHRAHHPIFRLLQQPYDEFAQLELAQRQQLHYPPFCRLVHLELSHPDRPPLERHAAQLGQTLRNWLGDALLGPAMPQVPRLKNRHRRHLLLKLVGPPAPYKAHLLHLLHEHADRTVDRKLTWKLDVDPR